jgi:hypothetical protein
MQATTTDRTASAATALPVAPRNGTFLRAGLLAGV